MNNTVRLATIFMLALSLRASAMEAILQYQGLFEHAIEKFPIDANKTANIITFCSEGKDKECAYFDYEVDRLKKSALVRAFVCDATNKSLRAFFFLFAAQHIHQDKNIKTISLFANKADLIFYKQFGAIPHAIDKDTCVLACDGRWYDNLQTYYAAHSHKNSKKSAYHV